MRHKPSGTELVVPGHYLPASADLSTFFINYNWSEMRAELCAPPGVKWKAVNLAVLFQAEVMAFKRVVVDDKPLPQITSASVAAPKASPCEPIEQAGFEDESSAAPPKRMRISQKCPRQGPHDAAASIVAAPPDDGQAVDTPAASSATGALGEAPALPGAAPSVAGGQPDEDEAKEAEDNDEDDEVPPLPSP